MRRRHDVIGIDTGLAVQSVPYDVRQIEQHRLNTPLQTMFFQLNRDNIYIVIMLTVVASTQRRVMNI